MRCTKRDPQLRQSSSATPYVAWQQLIVQPAPVLRRILRGPSCLHIFPTRMDQRNPTSVMGQSRKRLEAVRGSQAPPPNTSPLTVGERRGGARESVFHPGPSERSIKLGLSKPCGPTLRLSTFYWGEARRNPAAISHPGSSTTANSEPGPTSLSLSGAAARVAGAGRRVP